MKAKKILVVDDEKAVQDFFRDVLMSAGYEVLTAGTAVTAVNLARVEEPDLITLDIKLSMDASDEAWDGYSVVACLRRLSTSKPPPIVVISGTPDSGNAIEKALSAGIHTYLAKPVEREMLLRVIAEALKSKPADQIKAPPTKS
jgi:CheY-like chemotaxis protein